MLLIKRSISPRSHAASRLGFVELRKCSMALSESQPIHLSREDCWTTELARQAIPTTGWFSTAASRMRIIMERPGTLL